LRLLCLQSKDKFFEIMGYISIVLIVKSEKG